MNPLVSFLSRPESYPHGPGSVTLVETHASWVFLAPPYVFKVKKPVNLGFLDFSTLDKRRHFCLQEVALNRRLAPETYLGVEGIVRREGGFGFGTDGEVVEYAVKMRLLDPRYFLDHLMEQGAVGTRELDRVIERLASFYRAQKPTPEVEAWGGIDRLRISTDENFRQAAELGEAGLAPESLAAIRRFTDGFYRVHQDRFERRVREGRILDCHGDLHLEHVHLSPEGVQIYDCIEFNDRLRYVDVASDVAFLAMDLDRRGRRDLSGHLADRMAMALDDPGLRGLMVFYQCYRAFVRGKVEGMTASRQDIEAATRARAAVRAQGYFQLALGYAVSPGAPMALLVMGRIGSGKSTMARCLHRNLGWPSYSSDTIRKRLAGLPLHERTPAGKRSRLYSKEMTAKTYGLMLDEAIEAGRAGGGVIVDATFGDPARRSEARARFGEAGFKVCFVEMSAADDEIRRRLSSRSQRPGEISDARLEDFEPLSRAYEPPLEVPAGDRVSLRSGDSDAGTCSAALAALADMTVARA